MRLMVLLVSLGFVTNAQAQQRASDAPVKAETSVKRDEFAFGIALATEGTHALQRLVLPPSVYDALTRSDASDLAVFNKSGSQVPHALQRASESLRTTPDVRLPVFPLKAVSQDAVSAMAITVDRSENGAVTTVRTSEGVPHENTILVGYLVDTSSLEQAVRGLMFTWADESASFVQRLHIEASDDLTSWSSVADNTIARLIQDGQRIEKERIEMPPVRAKYLRVSWPGSAAPPTALATVTATLTSSVNEPARAWAKVDDVTTQSPSLFRVHVIGARPVDRLRIHLPENNTVAQATVSSAKTADGPWSTRFTGLVYRFDDRGIAYTTIPVDDVDDGYWQIEVSAQGGGLGAGDPAVEVGWLPHELVFVARGEPPFTLAYGNASKRVAAFDPSALVTIARGTGDETMGNATITEAKVELGGVARLTPEPPDTSLPVRRIVLWGSLGAAVLLLAWMSVRLFKQMGA